MRGMDATTGKTIEGEAHLRQSIADILGTPLGSRLMRRDYGSLLPELIDAPFNDATRVRLFGACAGALMRWEQRLRLTRVGITAAERAGAFEIQIEGVRLDTPTRSKTRLTIPLSIH